MQVTMVKDSISRRGIRLSTMHLRYWRPIHSELMTHRVFTRNARSSRAVPVATLLSEDLFIPQFGMNRPGMQSTQAATPELQQRWSDEWNELADITRSFVERWGKEGMHKQHANRPLEWFGWIDVLVSSTYWQNFWELRLDQGAQPELRELAEMMLKTMQNSKPQLLMPGEWHLPYISEEEKLEFDNETLLKLSTARCARLSYKPFDGNANIEAELERYGKLIVSRPVHASPAEHQATPDRFHELEDRVRKIRWEHPEEHGNFYGWRQHRKMIPDEAIMEF